MSTNKKTRVALLLGFLIVLISSGGGGESPEALAFGDETISDAESLVRRPVGNPCATSDYSVQFDAGVALSGGETSNVGPFNIALPAGVYDVTVSTWLGSQDLPTETNEQWSFSTDSGYASPSTIDSSPHVLMNQAWTAQEISATNSVELHHRAPRDVDVANSVHPLCIGFDAVEVDALGRAGEGVEGTDLSASESTILP